MTNFVFGDDDPEDAYDASDPPAERLRVLVAAVRSILEEEGGPRKRSRYDTVKRQLEELVAEGQIGASIQLTNLTEGM